MTIRCLLEDQLKAVKSGEVGNDYPILFRFEVSPPIRTLRTLFLSVIIAGLLAFSANNLLAATYFVSTTGSDNASGTSLVTAWRTIGKAAATMAAGDTTMVQDGTYIEGGINFRNSGTVSQPITLKAQNRWLARLSSISNCQPNISISGSYVVIDGIRISVDSSNTPCNPVNSASGTGIRCWNSNNPTSANPTTGWVGCTVRNTLIDPYGARGHAIKMNQDYALVENNEIYGGVEGMQSQSAVIRNNYIEGGDWWGNSVLCKGGSRSCQIYNNVVRQIPTSASGNASWLGLIMGGQGAGQWAFLPGDASVACYKCVAWNNVVISTSNTQFSLGMEGCRDCAAFNNVVINGNLAIFDDSRNSVFKNNIVVCNGKPATAPSWAWADLGTPSIDRNNFYNCTGEPPQTNRVSGDPRFVNDASDWHLRAGSPAIGSGVEVAFKGYLGEQIDLSRDKEAVVRTAPWSLGIYARASSSGDVTPPRNPASLRVQ
jgi:Chondroitinase B